MNSEEINDVEYENVEDNYISAMDELTYTCTATDIANAIGETVSTVREWERAIPAIMEQGYVKINPKNRYRKYSKDAVEIFLFIKDLKRDKKISLSAIRDLLDERVSPGKSPTEVVDIRDPLAYQALAAQLTINSEKMMESFKAELLTEIQNSNDAFAKKLMSDVGTTVQKALEETLPDLTGEVEREVLDRLSLEFSDQRNTLKGDVRSILNEENQETIKMFETLRDKLDQNKLAYEESQKKKGFWARIFDK